MTDQPKPKPRPVTTIIDDQRPRRMILHLHTDTISAATYEAELRAWLESVSPPSQAFLVARAIVAAVEAAK